MISETAYSSQTKLIGLNLHVSEHGIGYSNLTPDPQGARGAPGVKIQVSPNQKTSLTKVVRHNKGMIKVSSAPPEELHCEKKSRRYPDFRLNLRTVGLELR